MYAALLAVLDKHALTDSREPAHSITVRIMQYAAYNRVQELLAALRGTHLAVIPGDLRRMVLQSMQRVGPYRHDFGGRWHYGVLNGDGFRRCNEAGITSERENDGQLLRRKFVAKGSEIIKEDSETTRYHCGYTHKLGGYAMCDVYCVAGDSRDITYRYCIRGIHIATTTVYGTRTTIYNTVPRTVTNLPYNLQSLTLEQRRTIPMRLVGAKRAAGAE